MTSPTDPFFATSQDDSIWKIDFEMVKTDMIEHEEEDDKWPRPITREMAADYLADNADTVKGWSLHSYEMPERYNLTLNK